MQGGRHVPRTGSVASGSRYPQAQHGPALQGATIWHKEERSLRKKAHSCLWSASSLAAAQARVGMRQHVTDSSDTPARRRRFAPRPSAARGLQSAAHAWPWPGVPLSARRNSPRSLRTTRRSACGSVAERRTGARLAVCVMRDSRGSAAPAPWPTASAAAADGFFLPSLCAGQLQVEPGTPVCADLPH